MAEQFTTLGQSTLNGAITNVATSLVLTSAASFPATGTFRIRIENEIMKVTAVATNTLTVVRGQEGTTGASHADTLAVTEVFTAAAIAQFQTDILGLANMLLPLPTDTSITTTTTISSTGYGKMHVCSGTSANYAVTMPDATVAPVGTLIGIRMSSALTKLVTLTSSTGTQMDGLATRVMWASESTILLCDGTQWRKIAGRAIPMQCEMKLTSNQSVANGGPTVVNLDTAAVDPTGVMGDGTNHWVAIIRASNYLCICKAQIAAVAVSVPRIFSDLYNANGSVDLGSAEVGYYSSGISGYPAPLFAGTFPLVVGDHIQLRVYQSSGSSQNVLGQTPGDTSKLIVQEIPNW